MEDRALLLLYYQSATCMKTEDKFSCRRPRSVDRTGQPQFVADSEVNPGSRPRGPETRSRKLPEQRIEATRICDGQTADKALSWGPRLQIRATATSVESDGAQIPLPFEPAVARISSTCKPLISERLRLGRTPQNHDNDTTITLQCSPRECLSFALPARESEQK